VEERGYKVRAIDRIAEKSLAVDEEEEFRGPTRQKSTAAWTGIEDVEAHAVSCKRWPMLG